MASFGLLKRILGCKRYARAACTVAAGGIVDRVMKSTSQTFWVEGDGQWLYTSSDNCSRWSLFRMCLPYGELRIKGTAIIDDNARVTDEVSRQWLYTSPNNLFVLKPVVCVSTMPYCESRGRTGRVLCSATRMHYKSRLVTGERGRDNYKLPFQSIGIKLLNR